MTVIEAPTPPALSHTIGRFRFDPLGYVMHAFPWGRPHTALAGESGPEPWQREAPQKLGESLRQRDKTPGEAVRRAVASGHGVGKSALVAWIILWALSTLRDTRGVVTANTEGQLRTKTWPGYMKEWCKFGCLPDDRDLRADLTNVESGYDAFDAILLERKRDMRRRGLASPDDAMPLRSPSPIRWRGGTRRRIGASTRSCPS
jgi:hypothetical protein